MVRHSAVFVACAVLLSGCDRAPNMSVPSGEARMDIRPGLNAAMPAPDINIAPAQQQFSFTHSWSVLMAHGAVAPRFERARDLCLNDKALLCKLVSANLSTGEGQTAAASGSLEVQLPHGKLDVFEHALLAPVTGEKPGDAVMAARSTQAQSVETEASDTARKVAQLTAYRDRLAGIAKRPNLGVDDIIKVEAERARVQTDLDEATNRQRDLTDGIARESVSIELTERIHRPEPMGPFHDLFHDAGQTLAENAASALLFAIGTIPWLPIAAIVIFLVSLLWRWLLRRRALRVAVMVPKSGGPSS
ncbi:MAG: DUF4349 domain-containing protein [Rhizomicrobium sp.]